MSNHDPTLKESETDKRAGGDAPTLQEAFQESVNAAINAERWIELLPWEIRALLNRRSRWLAAHLPRDTGLAAVGPPGTVGFQARAEMFERLAELERRIAWAAACDASRRAHLKILNAADWLEDENKPLLRRLRPYGTSWSAVEELQTRGTEIFYPPRPAYAVSAITFEDGSVAADINRLLEPSPPAAELTGDATTTWLAGTVVLGDGEHSARIAERLDAVRQQANQLDAIATECYERAILDLDRTLLADAQRHDEARERRTINAPMVESLNRQP